MGKRDEDELIFLEKAKTTQHLLIFTNLGNVIYRPVHELTDIRWKDVGEHLSQTITTFGNDEQVLYAEIVDDFAGQTYFAVTKLGQIKRFERKEFAPWRTYKSKSLKYGKLKDETDMFVTVAPILLDDVLLVTHNGYALRFNIEEVPVIGAKAAGVKAINLKGDDVVVSAFIANTKSIFILTQRGSLKRMSVNDLPQAKRAGRGLQVLRELKAKPHRVFLAGSVFAENGGAELDLFATEVEEKQQMLQVQSQTGQVEEVNLTNLSLSERTSNGSFISDSISDQGVFAARVK